MILMKVRKMNPTGTLGVDIPAEMARKLGIIAGEYLAFEISGGSLNMQKVTAK